MDVDEHWRSGFTEEQEGLSGFIAVRKTLRRVRHQVMGVFHFLNKEDMHHPFIETVADLVNKITEIVRQDTSNG
jgi:hypothetical protein